MVGRLGATLLVDALHGAPRRLEPRICRENLACASLEPGTASGFAWRLDTHHAVANWLASALRAIRLRPEDAVAHLGPDDSPIAAMAWLWPLAAGARLVVPEPGPVAARIKRHQISVCHLDMPALRAFVTDPAAVDCADVLRLVLCDDGPPPPQLISAFTAVLPRTQLYWMPAGIHFGWQDAFATGPSPAATLPGVQAVIVDSEDELAPIGMPGNVCVAGASVPRGYWNDPRRTAERLVPDPSGGRRIYRTGRRGCWTGDGQLIVIGAPDEPAAADSREPPRRTTPTTSSELILAEIWREVLGLDDIGTDDEFYELGGDSMRAVTVFEQARQLGLLLPLRRMLAEHTIAELLQWLRDNPEAVLEQAGDLPL